MAQDENIPSGENNLSYYAASARKSESIESADDSWADDAADNSVDQSVDSSWRLWEGDVGTLPLDARSALLRLVKGPYLSETSNAEQWRALLNHAEVIQSRLADLFLELVIDAEAGVAFAKNVTIEGKEFPKAASSYTLTLLDTIMLLLLRKELQTAGGTRVFIGQSELFMQMGQYRNIAKMDQAAYLKRLEGSWSRLEKQRLLIKSDVEGRYEISPVLKLVFGAEEAQAVFDEYERMRAEADAGGYPTTIADNATTEGGTLFDGLL